MQIPKFKGSKVFADDIQIPCLAATLKSSDITGLGAAYREEIGEDPEFKIYLRSAKPDAITPWQQKFLDRLFTRDGLVPAIAAAMKEYQEKTGYEDDELKGDRILPHLYMTGILIDEIDQEVILELHTLADGCLDEHGIAIHWAESKWTCDWSDYTLEYLRKLDVDEAPAPGASGTAPTLRDLCGRWELDEAETTKRYQKKGMASELKGALEQRGNYYEITEQVFRWRQFGNVTEGRIIGFEWKKGEAIVRYEFPGVREPQEFGGRYKLDQLTMDYDVYRRLPLDAPAPASEWTPMDPTPLYGRWSGQTGDAAFKVKMTMEFTPERIKMVTRIMGMDQVMEQSWIRCTSRGHEVHFETKIKDKPGPPFDFVLKDAKLRWGDWVLKREK